MRLSLLARKLSVKPSLIIEELLVEGEKPLHGNSKLKEEQIEEIIQVFGPLPEEPEPTVEPISENTTVDKTVESYLKPNESSSSVVDEEVSEAREEVMEPKEEVTEATVIDEPTSTETIKDTEVLAATEVIEEETEENLSATIEEEQAAPFIQEEAVPMPVDKEIVGITSEETTSEETTSEENSESVETSTDRIATTTDGADEEKTDKLEVLVSDLLEDPDEELLENTDVLIKAPKVHLPGLTVKGKIELPEPKPKPEAEATGEEEENYEDNRGRRGRDRSTRRKQINPVTSARMREERRAERRKKAQQAQEKERKKKHYQQNIQSKAAPPPKKKEVKKPKILSQPSSTPKPVKNLNALQRFWKWMNT